MSSVLNMGELSAEPFESPIAADKVLEGSPVETIESHYESADEKFFTGYWSSTPGKWTVSYDEEEYFEFLSGKAVLSEDNGTRTEISPGDKIVIKAGFKGTWETIEACRKLYVIALK